MKLPKRFSFIKYKKNRYEYNCDGECVKIPSVMYPLNNSPEIFCYENTELITDEKIVEIIDSVPYKIGNCYSNTKYIVEELIKNGIKAEPYVGWLINGNSLPTHHAWLVIKKKYLVDISDDFDCFLFNINQMKNEGEIIYENNMKELLKEFMVESVKHKNSERCHLGRASIGNLYIGCKCQVEMGVKIFNNLIEKYPNHPCLVKGTDDMGRTPLQRELDDIGVL